tara:strand:- start:335 stop:805 length:471 start_codon:yes stop_codon:yes gene_type:complete
MAIHASSEVYISTNTSNAGRVLRLGAQADIQCFYLVWGPAGGGGTTDNYVDLRLSTYSFGFRGKIALASTYGWQNSIGMSVYYSHYGANGYSNYSSSIETEYHQNMSQFQVSNWTYTGSYHRFRIQNNTRASNPMWIYVENYGDARGEFTLSSTYM